MAKITRAKEERKQNQITLAAQIVVDVCIALAEFSPYVYAASPRTCSFYIKFHQCGLGSLRISNHSSKYLYKWNISVQQNYRDRISSRNNHWQYYSSYKNKEAFVNFMKETFKNDSTLLPK